MFECVELHWTEYLKAIGPTLIALYVAYVARQQWIVNRANLKERLFERRMEVLLETQSYLSEIFNTSKISESNMWAFNKTHQKARFLFGKDIQNYLIEIRSRSIDLNYNSQQSKNTNVDAVEQVKHGAQFHKDFKWLIKQADVVFDKYEPFLSFENHK